MGTKNQQAALDKLAREYVKEVFGEPTKEELDEMARLRAGKRSTGKKKESRP